MKVSQLFEKNFSLKNLEQLTDGVINKNTAQGIDNINFDSFCSNRDEHIEIIHRKVLKGNYKFSCYKQKLILKSRNSNPRLISIPTIRDRIVLKVIHNILKEIYPEIQLKLPQVYIQELTGHIERFNYYIKIDLSNFYGTISHGRLLNLLGKKIKYKKLLNLISQSLTNPTITSGQKSNRVGKEIQGVPQGIPISNFLASIYMLELDTKYGNKKEVFYVRYVDDIIILCDKKISKEVYSEILYDIEGLLSLKINRDKTAQGDLQDTKIKFDFLGYQFSKDKSSETCVSVKNQSKIKLEKSIIDIFHSYEKSKYMKSEEFIFRLNNKITGSVSTVLHPDQNNEIKKYGWLFYFSQINDYRLLYHLDSLVIKMFSKYPKCNKDIDKNQIKSFVKSYYEIKYNIKKTKYIHNPDILNIQERRYLLINTFGIKNAKNATDDYINALYYKNVYAPIKREYQDIQKFIS